ncbi:hypothetical protein CEUSTIGMA_g4830.t1 [Chlamydomonas eustigma]|uniref:Uncharacterized protein n=1 Tax=Chlamydomonas eustigma TaxID=1157962 RepID=A0A250X2R3_9CHLO|nr:hypothetical protein CEUSTIGMA_g4830.t1 [Chlamydomonas eustigma]|eukprot:GAX77384.1 hypothetical protein CEUSTIGMA_g4830.t1 [Chlamydomonas eustigma]
MLRQSKSTLRGNALFRELSTEKAAKQGIDKYMPALPNIIDDYQSEGHHRMLELIRLTGIRNDKEMEGVWATFGQPYKPLGGSPEEPVRALPKLNRDEMKDKEIKGIAKQQGGIAGEASTATGKPASSVAAAVAAAAAVAGKGALALATAVEEAAMAQKIATATSPRHTTVRKKSSSLDKQRSDASNKQHGESQLTQPTSSAAVLDVIRNTWDRQSSLLTKGGLLAAKESSVVAPYSRERGSRPSRYIGSAVKGANEAKPSYKGTAGSEYEAGAERNPLEEVVMMMEEELHPLERESRLQQQLLSKSRPDGCIQSLRTFNKLSCSLSGLLGVDVAAAVSAAAAKKLQSGIEPRGYGSRQQRASHKGQVALDPNELRAVSRFYGQLCTLLEIQCCADPICLMVLHKVKSLLEGGMTLGRGLLVAVLEDIGKFIRGCGMERHNRFLLSILTCMMRSCDVSTAEFEELVLQQRIPILVYGTSSVPSRSAASAVSSHMVRSSNPAAVNFSKASARNVSKPSS